MKRKLFNKFLCKFLSFPCFHMKIGIPTWAIFEFLQNQRYLTMEIVFQTCVNLQKALNKTDKISKQKGNCFVLELIYSKM